MKSLYKDRMQYVLLPLPYMHPNGEIEPKVGELPHVYSDRLGIYYTRQVTLAKKKENGQFFTPIAIGRLMIPIPHLFGIIFDA